MNTWLKQWLAAPVFIDDEEETFRASMLNWILLGCAFLMLILITSILIVGHVPTSTLVLDIIFVAILFTIRYALRLGRTQWIGSIVAIAGFILITFSIADLGTISTPVTSAFLFLIILVEIVFGPRGMILAVVACSSAIGGLMHAESAGMLRVPDPAVTPSQWILYAALFIVVGSFTYMAHKTSREALGRTQNEIKERERTESELRASEEKYRLLARELEERVKERTDQWQDLYDNAPIGYHSLDAQGKIVQINQTELNWFGYTRDELLGKPFYTIAIPERHESLKAEFERFLVTGQFHSMETYALRKDGTAFPVMLNATAIRDEHGQFVSSRITLTDITERKQAEDALRERERHSQSLLRLSRELEQAQSYSEILNAAQDEVKTIIGYSNLWIYLVTEDKKHARLLMAGGTAEDKIMQATTLPIEGDPMIEAIVRAKDMVVVEDARTDPRTDKKIVEMLGNRTIVNVPIVLSDQNLGAVGMGTFGDEGIKVPTEMDRDYLITLASHMAVTLDRIRLLDERKQAEEKLLKLSQQDQSALRIARMGHWEFDPTSGQFLFNDQYYTLHGMTAEEAGGYLMSAEKFARKYVHPEDASMVADAIRRGIESNDPHFQHQIDGRILRADGEPRNVVVWFRVEKDAQGRTIKLHGVNQDITERKRTENVLKRNVNFTTALLNAIPIPVFYKDNAGKYQGCNHAFTELMGKTNVEILGKTVHQLWPSKHADVYHQKDLELMQHREHQLFESFVQDKNGIEHPVIFVKDVFYDEGGNVAGLVGAFIDITERKHAEETLRQANTELERALRMKDEFLATVSHELRTPLNAVLGLAENLGDQILGPLNDRQLSALNIIQASGRHLLALINDILDLSGIQAGKVTLDVTPVDVRGICEMSLRFINQEAAKKQIKITSEQDWTVEWISADERRLGQMLINLLSNAIKFTPAGGKVKLQVIGDSEQQTVKFSVWDNGIGIAAEDFQRLFKPFVQLDSRLSRNYEGTGLGLVLVARIAELHGGNVSAESEPGKGSCFTITLPWSAEMQSYIGMTMPIQPIGEPIIPAMTVSPMPSKLSGDANAPLILIAEDNESNISALATFLQAYNYRLLIARDGNEALEMTYAEHPELILMDLQMPVLDGWEATRQLRKASDPQIANIPIIAVTALAMPGDRERAMAAGATEYMTKPVNLKQLVKLIEQVRKVQ